MPSYYKFRLLVDTEIIDYELLMQGILSTIVYIFFSGRIVVSSCPTTITSA